jgi:hypothetical protein
VNQRFAEGDTNGHNQRAELFAPAPRSFDRYEGDLHRTLELDIDALRNTGRRRGAELAAQRAQRRSPPCQKVSVLVPLLEAIQVHSH